ncbi:GNAT family N-acetyltransferase [Stenotrophomonas maltophilia]|uniref:GNAT family N-acetyltransferase n=1 Tax=Stenotrophomonas muris TaxID=2963283 RepID=UPI00146BE47B|nr:GNAT family N-acetyltransferase [Stenotrophomonas muris]MBN5016635.1 GNAT family N-acetyltransferase [Stenotrophomonas maltophilia]MCU1116899.1 GNAT family N-acetyltransferase [Stenotrophomonas maltophilia]MCU1132150.1 GNAT family N-acetyltransferase [Stenotrophomonas maltophilia]NMT36713.1 GNAT family N-acetyltransferase [Stenotrophomonas maltophilia]NMT74119.1 GNAT family N-acetyltransferase [Stenotrophomonas maltophilia]
MDDAISPLIDAAWQRVFAGQRTLQQGPQLLLACSDDVDEGEDGMLLQPVAGPARALLRPALAARLQLRAQPHWTLAQLQQRLQQLGQHTHGADRVFYFPTATLAALAEHPAPPHIRRLGATDAAAFNAFQATASEDDLDAAWVELDHWQVFGAFDGERLVAAGSMYPWSLDPAFADMGVLTLPEARGRGHARQLVHAMAVSARASGLQPQYRCQLDNTASIITAGRSGLRAFADWDTILAAD